MSQLELFAKALLVSNLDLYFISQVLLVLSHLLHGQPKHFFRFDGFPCSFLFVSESSFVKAILETLEVCNHRIDLIVRHILLVF